MAGAGGNSTHEAIELSRFAKKVGADCTLQVVPYYNRPSQEGIYRHFRAIAEAVDIPMVLYNVPGRTVADMQHDTVLKLAQVDGIVGIKEATGNIERAAWLIKQAPRGFLDLLRRRRHRGRADAARRPRQRQRHRQRGAAADARVVHGRRRGAGTPRRRDPPEVAAGAPAAVLRAEPRAHQVGDGPPGAVRRRLAAADGRRCLPPARRRWSRRCARPACFDNALSAQHRRVLARPGFPETPVVTVRSAVKRWAVCGCVAERRRLLEF